LKRAGRLFCPPTGVFFSFPIGQTMETTMLRWALIFFIVALVAAVFGFGGIAASAVGIARILFMIFVVLFLVSLLIGLISGRQPPLGPTL
jgi:uncharacterized membrane protein YtjA (UPF0391 family)